MGFSRRRFDPAFAGRGIRRWGQALSFAGMDSDQAGSRVDEFLGSVREVFARNRSLDWMRIGLVVAAAVTLAVVLGFMLSRRRARRTEARRIQDLASGARLSRIDLDFLGRMAAEAGLPLFEVLGSLAAFERATAGAVAAKAPPLSPTDQALSERIRLLRKSLGFWPLPAHRWLLSTRELVPGDAITVLGATGQVVDVSEASISVELGHASNLALESTASASIVRPDDSMYLCHLPVLGFAPSSPGGKGGPARVDFGHDEHPQRQQHREHVRVRVKADVTMIVSTPAPSGGSDRTGSEAPADGRGLAAAAAPVKIAGQLIDLSAGGLSMELGSAKAPSLHRGTEVQCSFVLGSDEVFEDLPAIVAAAEPGPRSGVQHLRLAFGALSQGQRDRLASIVDRHLRTRSAEARPPSESSG